MLSCLRVFCVLVLCKGKLKTQPLCFERVDLCQCGFSCSSFWALSDWCVLVLCFTLGEARQAVVIHALLYKLGKSGQAATPICRIAPYTQVLHYLCRRPPANLFSETCLETSSPSVEVLVREAPVVLL